ncbi:MAG: hypothetical protein HUJ53_01890 [Holdemanella sp.]|nr:hypothetical protein [Holdemanella sp.]
MGIMDLFKKKKNTESDILDDMSYIADLHHIEGVWNQYDFLLNAQGYGWNYIVDSADYMVHADLENIGTISVTKTFNEESVERIDEFNLTGSIQSMNSLSEESIDFGIGGTSKILGAPIKIVWFNQTRVIRIFTPINDEILLTRYAETMIRRTFGTPDEMKLAKSVK